MVRNTIGATQQECKFFDPGFDDRHSGEITVPACWQAEGHQYSGVAWYRTRFEHHAGAEAVVRLAFQGVDYFADAWINGYYLGSPRKCPVRSAARQTAAMSVNSGPSRPIPATAPFAPLASYPGKAPCPVAILEARPR